MQESKKGNRQDAEETIPPEASDKIVFTVEGPGEIIATDNGDPADLVSFPSPEPERNAFNGLTLVIVRAGPGKTGKIRVTARQGTCRRCRWGEEPVRVLATEGGCAFDFYYVTRFKKVKWFRKQLTI